MIQRFEHGGNVYQPSPKGKAWLDFSANINPLGLSPAVRQALAAHLDQVVHYPDPAGTALRQALEQAYGVPGGSIVLGNGAAELFYLYMQMNRSSISSNPTRLIRSFARPGTGITSLSSGR